MDFPQDPVESFALQPFMMTDFKRLKKEKLEDQVQHSIQNPHAYKENLFSFSDSF